MSEPPQPSWQGNQPDPTEPVPQTPPTSGPPAPEPPSYNPPPSSGAPDPFAAPPPPASPSSGQPGPYAAPPPAYGQPADPFGAATPPPPPPGFGGQAPGQPAPGQPYPGGPGAPGFPGAPGAPGFPGAAPPKKSNAGKIALIIGIVAAVLLCLCGAGVVWAINQAGDEIEKQIDALPTIDVTAEPTAEPTADPTGGASGDEEDFDEGDCLVNNGTDASPDLAKVACAPGTFEVIAKVPFSTDKAQCDNDILGAGRGNYDSTYTYDETPGTLNDFVLCLKER